MGNGQCASCNLGIRFGGPPTNLSVGAVLTVQQRTQRTGRWGPSTARSRTHLRRITSANCARRWPHGPERYPPLHSSTSRVVTRHCTRAAHTGSLCPAVYTVSLPLPHRAPRRKPTTIVIPAPTTPTSQSCFPPPLLTQPCLTQRTHAQIDQAAKGAIERYKLHPSIAGGQGPSVTRSCFWDIFTDYETGTSPPRPVPPKSLGTDHSTPIAPPLFSPFVTSF